MPREGVTLDEIERVRRYECSIRGHSWDVISVVGQEDPVSVICSNCGRRCLVESVPQNGDSDG